MFPAPQSALMPLSHPRRHRLSRLFNPDRNEDPRVLAHDEEGSDTTGPYFGDLLSQVVC
jgi:hypothetical protein